MYLKVWVGSCRADEEDGETPDGVREGRAVGEVGQRAQHPVLQHGEVTLVRGLPIQGEHHTRHQNLR